MGTGKYVASGGWEPVIIRKRGGVMADCEIGFDREQNRFCCFKHNADPALCTHAAAGLERRLEAQATSIKTYQQVCARLEQEKAVISESRLAAEKDFNNLFATNEHLDSIIRENECQIERLTASLAQAEAREAAMREALRSYGDHKPGCAKNMDWHTGPECDLPGAKHPRSPCSCGFAAVLSHDAGRASEEKQMTRPDDVDTGLKAEFAKLYGEQRQKITPHDCCRSAEYLALAAEVEGLREVARASKVFSKLNIEHLRDWPDDRELWDCGGTMLRVGHVRKLRDVLTNILKETP